MRFTINLATRTYLDNRMLNRFAVCAITILLIISAWNVSRISSNMGEQSRLNDEVSVLQGKIGAKPSGVSEVDFSRQKARIRFYNAVLERKSINWLSLLESFENVTPEGISLSSLSQGTKHEEWKLEGRARSFKLVQQYLEKLESSKSFSNVMLLSHQNLTVGEKVHGIQFTISCKVLN